MRFFAYLFLAMFVVTEDVRSAPRPDQEGGVTGLSLDSAVGASWRDLEASIVPIIVAKRMVDMDSPWRWREVTVERYLSVVVSPTRLLTTAWAVRASTSIEMQRFGQSSKRALRVVRVDAETNLALLEAEGPDAFAGLVPVKIGEALSLNSNAWIWSERDGTRLVRNPAMLSEVGFVTSGMSAWPWASYLFKTQQTALGWSEPVFLGGQLVALTTGQDDANVYAIPSPVIERFIQNDWKGPADVGLTLRPLLAPEKRGMLKAPPGGILVTEVDPSGPFAGEVKPGDVIHRINGVEVSESGLFKHPKWGRISARWLLTSAGADESVTLGISRLGESLEITAKTIRADSNRRSVPWDRGGAAEPHLVYGGFVFMELSRAFLMDWGREWRQVAPLELLVRWERENRPGKGDEKVIVLNRVLADAWNHGYEQLQNLILSEVNGTKVKSLSELRTQLDKPIVQGSAQFTILRFELGEGEVVLDASTAPSAEQRIAANYGTGSLASFHSIAH
jgi:hypothetical protein